MRVNATCDTSKGKADLAALAERIRETAVPRTLNALIDQAQRTGLRQIAITYRIAARTIEQYATQKPARADDPEASITVKGKGFPLSLFNPVQGPKGVTVTIKGRRVLIPHSFQIRGRFAIRHAGITLHVFARGSYGGKYGGTPSGQSFGRFLFNKSRLPISEIWSFAPPDAFSNPQVVDAMQDIVDGNAGKELQRQIAAVTRGF